MTSLEAQLAHAHDRIRALEAELGADFVAPARFGLTASEARILGVIMARPLATRSAVLTLLYGNRPEADIPDPQVATVLVSKMRKKLEPFGVEIETVWGQGWRMSAEGKAVVRGDAPDPAPRPATAAATGHVPGSHDQPG